MGDNVSAEELDRNVRRFFYLESKVLLCANPINYLVYRDEFETLTEYNGFITEC